MKKLSLSKTIGFVTLLLLAFSLPSYAEDTKEVASTTNDDNVENSSMDFKPMSLLDKLHVYGWFSNDLTFSTKSGLEYLLPLDTFRLNVISIFEINDNFKIFQDIEYEKPLGNDGSGKILIDRLLFEYSGSDAFTLHLGKFLLPFGLWNVAYDANPNYLSVFLPGMYAKGSIPFPKKGTGIWLSGTPFISNIGLEYNLYAVQINSSETVNPAAKSINPLIRDKGLGGNIFATPFEWLKLGTSFYFGEKSNVSNLTGSTYGLSTNLKFANFESWAEVFYLRDFQDTKNKDGLSYYLWLSYNLGYNITPYIIYNSLMPDLSSSKDNSNDITAGINYLLTSQVTLKAQAHIVMFDNNKNNYNLFATQLTASF